MRTWLSIVSHLGQSRERFEQALHHPLDSQLSQLRRILRTQADTAFGRRHGFGDIQDVEDFRQCVPVLDYEALRQDIQAMAGGAQGRLCRECLFFEETGGSTAGPKLIPQSAAGLAALQRALRPWLADLVAARPDIAQGRAYWAVSPATRQPRELPGGLPVGSGNDCLYFGEDLAPELLATLAVSPQVGQETSVETWRYLTLLQLLAAEDLTLISVWSPSFLIELMAQIPACAEALLRDLHSGTISAPATVEIAPPAPNPVRARQVEKALARGQPDSRRLWPCLDTLSCWTDAAAMAYVPTLRSLFPQVHIQGKGLLATEGIVTVPWSRAPAPVLAVESGFYEFLDGDGMALLCHELRPGCAYRVVITTHAGLYRYDTGDRVRMEGWYHHTPMLRFLGREGVACDLCGEKLTEPFVNGCLGEVRGFALLVPGPGPKPGYRLFVDATCYGPTQAEPLARRIEWALMANPQYRYARDLGQLAALRVVRTREPTARYLDHELGRGRVLGGVKPPSLSPDPRWAERLGEMA